MTKTTHDHFTVRSYAPWATDYSIDITANGKYTNADLVIRSGEVATTITLGSHRAALLALAEVITRAADKLEDRRGETVDWHVRNTVKILRHENELGDSSNT